MRPKIFLYSGGNSPWIILGTIVIGAALLAAAGAWGAATVAERLLPIAGQLAVAGLGIFVCGVLPLSLVGEWRPSLARLSFWIGSLYALGVWMASFLVLWKWLRFFALPALFLPGWAAPLAVIRLAFAADWNQAAGIALAALIARAIRSYAVWLTVQVAGAWGRPGPADAPEVRVTEVIDTVSVESRAEEKRP